MEYLENKTHSNVLYALLNPNSPHHFGNAFLKLFLDKLDFIIDYDVEKFTVNKEVSFSNGRMDLMISSQNHLIVIENKINANDGIKQLKRYHDFLKWKNIKHKKLFYLTLDGKDATEESKMGLQIDIDFFVLSYKVHIKSWIESCLKEAFEHPILRETLKQYLILIKKITGQLNNKMMEQELFELIAKDKTTFQAAKVIKDNFDVVVAKLINNQLDKLLQCLKSNDFLDHFLSTDKSPRIDEIFIPFKEFCIEGKEIELGINVELSNNYYFFCIIEKGKKREGKNNDSPKYIEIQNHIFIRIEGLNTTPYSIGMCKEKFVIIENMSDQWLLTDNTEAYIALSKKLYSLYEIINSEQN